MNKKILSILVMVMALSLLGVSCNNKNTTGSTDENGGGGSTTTQNKEIGTVTFNPDATQIGSGVVINAGTTTSVSGAKEKALTMQRDGSDVANQGYTFTISKVVRETTAVGGESAATVDNGLQASDFTYDGAKITLKNGTSLDSGWTSNSVDAYAVTIKISKDGYNDKEVVVYVALKGAA